VAHEARGGESRQTVRVDGRGWWTVILTALAGPLGGFGLGLALARVAEATTGGMAVLAWAVVGLMFGVPLAALVVFGICLVTLMRGVAMRRWLALLVMLATVVAGFVVTLIGLRMVGGMSQPQLGLIGTGVAVTVVLGLGAAVALIASRRAEPAVDVTG
jgi:hypothetical protein